MRAYLLAFALTVVSLAPPRVADACGNVVHFTVDEATKVIADAELALEKGSYRAAMNKVARLDLFQGPTDGLRDHRPGPRLAPTPQRTALDQRKQRVLAIAHLRLGYTKTARWMLASLVKGTPDDPVLQARYAESLVATGYLKRGRTILVDLQARDLMPDAPAWVALAKLHDGAGEIDLRERALTGCKAIATKAEACTLATAPAKPPKAAAKS